MGKKIGIGATIGLMALTAAVAVSATAAVVMKSLNADISDYGKRSEAFRKLSKVDSIVRSQYVGKLDENTIENGMVEGYMSGVGDKYGTYLDSKDYKQIALSDSGKSVGIGVNVVKNSDGLMKVISVIKDSPAEKAGVETGDVITKIGTDDIAAIGYESAVTKLRGSEGTTAAFTVKRGGSDMSFQVKREKFNVPTVQSHVIGNLGYIRITEFDKTTSGDFTKQLDNLEKKNVKGLIFDVRNNPGGLLEAVEPMIDELVPSGPVVRARYKKGPLKVLYTSDKKQVDLPMTVLTNENTASAAELFTAALKDYKKAVSIGTKTYGKGTMQQIIDLGDGTALDLSVAHFYPPKSGNFEGKGVKPDITVKLSKQKQQEFYTLPEKDDDQLRAAEKYLGNKLP